MTKFLSTLDYMAILKTLIKLYEDNQITLEEQPYKTKQVIKATEFSHTLSIMILEYNSIGNLTLGYDFHKPSTFNQIVKELTEKLVVDETEENQAIEWINEEYEEYEDD